jgi:hypothetical protein
MMKQESLDSSETRTFVRERGPRFHELPSYAGMKAGLVTVASSSNGLVLDYFLIDKRRNWWR